jgi:hypothetical protein
MQGGPQLKKWLVVAAVSNFPWAWSCLFPGLRPYVKGAQEWTLGPW